MTQPTAEFSSAEQVLEFIQTNPSAGPILVLAPEVLQQIQNAEAAGGFEGGMSGMSGDGSGGFSAEGNAGPNASSAADLPPLDIDLEGAVTSEGIALVVDGVVNLASGVVEAAHWIAERGAGPILIVPEKELKRLAESRLDAWSSES